MTLALILGFVMTAAAGATAAAHGRVPGAVVAAGGAAGIVIVAITAGRDAAGEAALGALVGLPVLLGGLTMRARRDRAHAHAMRSGMGV